KSCFVKFHWKPLLGVHSVAWDEATRISGKDPDFHRRDLSEAIDSGAFPEWEFGVQIVKEEDEHKFEFDLLDPTKLIPEELVPVQRIGKMVLNRNPDNFFAETEQVAFHPGHIVSGIDFTNDPLLQGRLFSYTDTQLSRLGSPNFHEIPINRSIAPVHNNQRDAHMRMTIDKGKAAYEPNTVGGGCPFQAMMSDGGFHSHEERIDAKKVRARSNSFHDHFSQATLFYNSQSEAEKTHIVNAFSFELGKLEADAIRVRMVGNLTQVDASLAKRISAKLGIDVPKPAAMMNQSFGADTNPKSVQPVKAKSSIERSAALSMANTVKDTIKTRRIAILAGDGVDGKALGATKNSLENAGAVTKIIAPKLGPIKTAGGDPVKADEAFFLATSVVYDAVFVAGGNSLATDADAIHFVNEAYKHCKAIAAASGGADFLKKTFVDASSEGVITGGDVKSLIANFVDAVAQHRFWSREEKAKVPA
ncbi:MAG: catalase, partial [Pyrinomonadaceae bacterium]